MPELTISISENAGRMLQDLTRGTGQSVVEVIERALSEFQDRQFWEAVNRGYAELRADPEAWAAEEAERRAWDATLQDGLDPSERWTEEGTPQTFPPGGNSS
jgi:predicted transcriptional regulator